jgi:anti-sigma factor RsiW
MTASKNWIDLMAFVDNELAPHRRREIEELALRDHEVAADIEALHAQRAHLKECLDPVLEEPIPQRLLRVKTPSRFPVARIAAALAIFLIGGSAGGWASWEYLARSGVGNVRFTAVDGSPDLPRFVHQATVAYAVYTPDVRHPVELAAADQQALESWLSGRLGRNVNAPDLTGLGFSLIGGRLLPAELNKPAAQFMYENLQGRRVTVYLRGMAQPTPETAFRYARKDGIGTFYWVQRNWGYALSSELPRIELLHVARTIYEQLSG